jgi:hypothetical protein
MAFNQLPIETLKHIIRHTQNEIVKQCAQQELIRRQALFISI